MALPVSFWSHTINDNTLKANGQPETTTMQLAVTTLTAANVAAQSALVINLENAVDGVTIGQPAKSEIVFERTTISAERADTPLAQRENKWLMRYHSNTLNQKFQVSIGTADLSLLPDGSEFLDLSADEGLALKTAFDAIVKSPNDAAEACTLDSVQFVGRNT